MWTKAKVRRVIPINVGITSPKRRRMNCNITRILSHDPRPGTVSLYCSQILSHANCIADKALRRMALRLSGLHNTGAQRSFNYSTETFSK
ncbi:hypothetical protein LFZ43_19280 [Salmonella enterica subsp. enterica serovar Wandsworth str. SA20092095]|nr:hypothetical protein LFZ88_19420 [Salmonella enterica subsp. enterica serovar Bardo]APY52195.1 hypothetical protein LFZ7_19130 [Salmonella enterica subsp. enterica serovar Crossness str. 1422-74]APY74424.1 hypothetical protein LFZ24_19775 [Salmonella enterica subsp. enterica serovar Krefeld str. SA20030536]APY83259.1 hypothetical protein LFZ93_18785 [Salmonella enterica subsp. enterica serovar Nitra]APZ67945.1 hypothetical protein LFZ43_19280 [Salmonella enterica subsp. enterica serovar Wand